MPASSDILNNRSRRNEAYKNNPKLDALIIQLRRLLEPAENLITQEYEAPNLPVILVVGNSRSGSTLLTQILAASGNFSYPSNVLNRFAYAPAIGAMIQQMLFNKEYGYLDELSDIQSPINFESQIGKTNGALGISEFYHFWRRFIPNYDLGHLSSDELANCDIPGLRSELAALEAIFEKPFMCKGKAIQYNIHACAENMPELFFIHIERDPLYVMQSLLESRRHFYQSETIWFGVKPPEFQELKNMDIYHQIAGQVLFSDHNIKTQLTQLAPNQSIHCRYEDLCAHPAGIHDHLINALALGEHQFIPFTKKDLKFPNANEQRLDEQELNNLGAAYNELSSRYDLNA